MIIGPGPQPPFAAIPCNLNPARRRSGSGRAPANLNLNRGLQVHVDQQSTRKGPSIGRRVTSRSRTSRPLFPELGAMQKVCLFESPGSRPRARAAGITRARARASAFRCRRRRPARCVPPRGCPLRAAAAGRERGGGPGRTAKGRRGGGPMGTPPPPPTPQPLSTPHPLCHRHSW
jgi:hypothetical protein